MIRPLGGALIQSDGCPYKKRTLGHTYTQKEGYGRQREDGHLEAKDRGLRTLLTS